VSTCRHLYPLEATLIASGIRETTRGQVWSERCREWVYFDCTLDVSALQERFRFDSCVAVHEHRGTHDGSEKGFYCSTCHDGIMGYHPSDGRGKIFA